MIILADAAAKLPDPTGYSAIGWVSVTLVCIIIGLRQGMKFVRDLKDKPTASDVLEKARREFQPKGDYAMRSELADLKRELNETCSGLSDENTAILKAGDDREARLTQKIEGAERTFNRNLQDIERALGRIEGAIEKK